MTQIKIDLEEKLKQGPVIVELGCGPRSTPGRIGIDHLDLDGVSIVADLNEGLGFLPDNSVDEIHSNSLLEHIDKFEFLMSEILRVLKPGGKKFLFVPHFSNPYFYSDYTHIRMFGLYTFYYFVDPQYQLKRKVPVFYQKERIQIDSLELVFDSPFRISKVIKRIFGSVVNLHPTFQEIYEAHFCYLVPCYGIRLSFTKQS